ncbi:hypothetical protein SGPA1_50151 [Streptomyces misionensis JCM 4497]
MPQGGVDLVDFLLAFYAYGLETKTKSNCPRVGLVMNRRQYLPP